MSHSDQEILIAYSPGNSGGERHEEEQVQGFPYFISGHRIHMYRETSRGFDLLPLANFEARIKEEEILDNGAETERYFIIEGTLYNGEPLPEITVSADRYPQMKWPTSHWGSRAVIFAGTSRDHMRAAVQLLSGNVPQISVYAHSGWRKIANRWLYLHSGGAIGAGGSVPEVRVALDGRLGHFELPDPPAGSELVDCVRASLQILDLAPSTISVPLFCSAFRAPLGEMAVNDFSVFFYGETGGQKTELTVLGQAHYGSSFQSRNLPGNWTSTENALEKQAFELKDAICAVDDFVPLGTSAEVSCLHRKADRLFRGQGNVAGRSRLRPDGKSGAEYHPRGIAISSGEDLPRVKSLRARLFVIEVSPGDVDLQKLTEAQEDAASGLLAQAMAGYLQWLAPQVEKLKESLPDRQKELRSLTRTGEVQHDRTPDIQASLALGLEMFLEFAHACGAITNEEKAALWQDGWDALAAVAKAQNPLQAEEDPADRFVELLADAITAGRAHLVDAKTGGVPKDAIYWGWRSIHGRMKSNGECIGWLHGDVMLLEPSNAFRMAKRLAHERGENLPITQKTLWKRLRKKDFLSPTASGKNVAYLTVENQRRYVLHMPANVLSHFPGTVGTPGTDPLDESSGAPDR